MYYTTYRLRGIVKVPYLVVRKKDVFVTGCDIRLDIQLTLTFDVCFSCLKNIKVKLLGGLICTIGAAGIHRRQNEKIRFTIATVVRWGGDPGLDLNVGLGLGPGLGLG